MADHRPTVVVLSHWPWDTHFWQFNKQVGLRLAELGHQVLWVDDRLRMRRDGFVSWMRGFPFGRVTTAEKMRRLQPWSVSGLRLGERNPVPSAVTAAQIRRYLRRLRLAGEVVLVYSPDENAIARRLEPSQLVFWTGDDTTLPNEDWLVDRADTILALSAPTYAEMAQRAPGRTFRVPTGVPFDMFVEAADEKTCPPEMVGLPRPIFGFAGNITADRIDFAIVRELANSFPHGTVAFVGPCEQATLDWFPPNVVFIAEQPYAEIPRFMAQFDVGIAPYLHTRFNERSSPLKVHEYFAVGLPVVGTGLSALTEYEELAVIAETPAEFAVAAGDAARTRHDPDLIDRRRGAAAVNGVDRIAETVSSLISRLAH
ncbi:MAG: glycosyltransferase [Actinobacteria bacterium]|nr:glycosyltransferase [Actinomycetota bacterium]